MTTTRYFLVVPPMRPDRAKAAFLRWLDAHPSIHARLTADDAIVDIVRARDGSTVHQYRVCLTAAEAGEPPSTASIRLLLDAGADPQRADATGETPISVAERYGFSEAITVMLAPR